MKPGEIDNDPSEPLRADTLKSDAARMMTAHGWFDDGAKLWVSASGDVRLTDVDSSFAGEVRVGVTRRVTILVDRLSPDRLTGLEIAGPTDDLETDEWSTLEYVAGAEFTRFVRSRSEGLLPLELPPLPLPLQRLALAASLAELVHPIFALEATGDASENSQVADAARRLAAISTPFVDALDDVVDARQQAGQGRPADAAVVRQLAGLPLGPTSPALGTNGAAGASVVADYDLIEIDDVLGATVEFVGSQLVVSVESQEVSDPVYASTADRTGRRSTTEVIFERGSTTGSAVLPRPSGEFWVEVHGPDEPTQERWERAAESAGTAAARLVAVIQAIAAGRSAVDGLPDFSAELHSLADLYEKVAFDPLRAEQTRRFAAQLERGENPFLDLPEIRTTEVVDAAQVPVRAHLERGASPPEPHRSDLLRSLLAGAIDTTTTVDVPDFVPIDWIEQFERTELATPLPDRALALSTNSVDDASHRVELDDEQFETTGISSIIIVFSHQTVTVTVTREPDRARYSLRIIETDEALEIERTSNPIADVHVAGFRGARTSVRIEFVLGPDR